MSVTAVELSGVSGFSGSASGESSLSTQISYDVHYLVTISDLDTDLPQTVLTYFKNTAGLPWIGDSYAINGERDPFSICKRITPQRTPKSYQYTVTVSYEPLNAEEPQNGTDKDGNATDDPLLFHDEINISYTQTSIPVELATFKGINLGGVNGAPVRNLPINSVTIPVNSALVPFDPGIEMELDIKIVQISRNLREFDGITANRYIGTVNSDAVNINKPFPYNYRDAWGPQTAKIKNISGTFMITNKIPHWRQTIEVHINPLGWRRQIVDRGLARRAIEGDPDGAGGTISASDINPGVPKIKRVVDSDGYPIAEPVLFDGDGQPLAPGLPVIYLEYEIYQEIPFAGIPW